MLLKNSQNKAGQQKIQSIGRTVPLRNEFMKQREAAINLQRRFRQNKAAKPARLSGVHEVSRQGATTTRQFEMNQSIGQLLAQEVKEERKNQK